MTMRAEFLISSTLKPVRTSIGFCHKFFTYNQAQADKIRTYIPDFPVYSLPHPEIGIVDTSGGSVQIKMCDTFLSAGAPAKKIMIFSTIYNSDQGRTIAAVSVPTLYRLAGTFNRPVAGVGV